MTAEERAEALARFAEQIAAAAQDFCDAVDRVIAGERVDHEQLMASLRGEEAHDA